MLSYRGLTEQSVLRTSGSQNLAVLPKPDTIVAFFLEANKKLNAKVALASSNS